MNAQQNVTSAEKDFNNQMCKMEFCEFLLTFCLVILTWFMEKVAMGIMIELSPRLIHMDFCSTRLIWLWSKILSTVARINIDFPVCFLPPKGLVRYLMIGYVKLLPLWKGQCFNHIVMNTNSRWEFILLMCNACANIITYELAVCLIWSKNSCHRNIILVIVLWSWSSLLKFPFMF